MAEYIIRAELIENLNKFAPEHLTPLIRSLIEKQPTADVVEVKHAKWVNGFCSNCKQLNPTSRLNERTLEFEDAYLQYCPNCGAKMDSQL